MHFIEILCVRINTKKLGQYLYEVWNQHKSTHIILAVDDLLYTPITLSIQARATQTPPFALISKPNNQPIIT